ncbi:MAG: hypothetical protein ACYDH8_00475 [Syntrophales bacterium]
MTPLFGVSLLLSLATGFFVIRLLLPEPAGERGSLPFQLFLGAGIGIGLSSCVYFLCMAAGITGLAPLLDGSLCLFSGALAFYIRRPAKRTGGNALAGRTKNGLLLLTIFSVELAASCGAFFFAFLKEPHGRWDAWLIWNMHARFLARSGEAWREVFSLPMDWSHWDYPLLLPLSIVRGWKYAGAEGIYIPAALAFIFFLLTAGLLLFAVSRLQNLAGGLLATMLLLATPFFILMGISQFADIPFSFFVLATIVLLFLPEHFPEKGFGPLILAGIAAGLAAWTKNEGLLFFLIAALVLATATAFKRGGKAAAVRSGWFLAGALPILLFVIYFKMQLAPPNDLATGFAADASGWSKLTDLGRYGTIAKAFFITGLNFTQGPVDLRIGMKLNFGAVNILLPVAWLWFMGVNRDPKNRMGVICAAAILLLMLSGYFAVYLLSPLPLDYQIATSLNRLYLQLWPSIVFLFFMMANQPENDWRYPRKSPAAAPQRTASKSSSPRRKQSLPKG